MNLCSFTGTDPIDSYDSAGALTTTDYSDATPDVTILFDKLGRQQSITTSVAKSEFTYDPATLAPDTETLSYNLDANPSYEFTRVLDRSRDSLNRDTGFQLKSGTTVENQATYGYSAPDGRLAAVIGGGDVSSPQTFTYGYLPNSNLLQTVTGPIHTVINQWEPTRDVLDTKQNKVGSTIISSYDYAVNVIGQRTGVTTSGSAFPNLPSWAWAYDSLGQVTSADSSVSTSDRAYQYDAIGNRKKSDDSLTLPTSDNYTSNALNQYTAIQQGGTGVSPVYDFDGNATAYPLPVAPTTLSTLIWDAENRLTEIKNSAGATLERNLFDSGSRKIATIANGVTTLYLYDAWNCIAEYSDTTLAKTRLWGMDLSGTMQGAGGVGGLLSESQLITSNPITFSSFFPTYDGNGNISEYLAINGIMTAHFEYDPFGNTMVNTDTNNQFAYRFSTKPLAFTTGLYYYGYRYYDPMTGRWLSRDPIGERGGVNLYGFVKNDGVNHGDYLGMRSSAEVIINGDFDALWHYWFGLGKTAKAGQEIIQEIRNSKDWEKNKNKVVERITKELDSVSCDKSSGELSQAGGTIGIYSENNALGDVDIIIDPYVAKWTAGDFDRECCRTIDLVASRNSHFEDKYAFAIDLADPKMMQIFTDLIPAIVAVDGAAYSIHGEFVDQVRIYSHKQCCKK